MTTSDALLIIPEKHRLAVKVISQVLVSEGGQVSPMRDLLPALQKAFEEHELPAIVQTGMSQYIRKYEVAGFFKRTVSSIDKRINILSITPLGRELVDEFQIDLQDEITIVWSEKIKWKLETHLRNKRSWDQGTTHDVDDMIKEIHKLRKKFGLKSSYQTISLERLLSEVIQQRFNVDEIHLNKVTHSLEILQNLQAS